MSTTVEALVSAVRSRIRELSPAGYAAWRARDHVLVDVREPGQFAQGHLPGAVSLARGVLEFRIHAHPALAVEEPPAQRRRMRVQHCPAGGRSALAADSLEALGFIDVHSLAGGLEAWRNAGFPAISE